MPSAPRLAERPSVPREPRHADLGASRQLGARLPTPTARLRPRCRRIPISPRARPPIAQHFSFGERLCRPRSPDARAKGLRFRRFPHRQDLRPPLLSPISCIRQKPFTKRRFYRKGRRTTEPPSAPRPASCARHPLGKRPQPAQRGRRTVAQSGCSGEKRGFDWTNVVAPRSALLPPNRYPRLVCALALQNDPPDFWRRGGQKGRSRALGQRFARMPP